MVRFSAAARRSWRVGALAAALAGVWAFAAPAEALADGGAEAEALFVEGRNLLREQKHDLACPKLARSHELDPATGTLLALALCYEGQGKIASAWSAYVEVVARAENEKNVERKVAAKERAAALEPRLSRLTVQMAPTTARPAGLRVTRDGVALADASLGTAVPIDPGEHEVVAEAPGKQSQKERVRLAEGESKRVTVGPLADAVTAPPATDAGLTFFTPMRIAGVLTGAVGVVGLAVSGGLAGAAVSKKAQSDEGCVGDVCDATGFPLRKEARSLGDGATVALVAGSVLAAAGVTLVIVGGPSRKADRAALVPVVSPSAGGLVVRGAF